MSKRPPIGGTYHQLRRISSHRDHAPNPPLYTRWEGDAEYVMTINGDWYRLADNRPSGTLAKDINAGKVVAFREAAYWSGEFKAKALKNLWGTYDIYVRFISG